MEKKERMPKAEYFRMRYKQAVENGNTKKADYYKSRLKQMGEPIDVTKLGKLTRHEFDFGLVIYSY